MKSKNLKQTANLISGARPSGPLSFHEDAVIFGITEDNLIDLVRKGKIDACDLRVVGEGQLVDPEQYTEDRNGKLHIDSSKIEHLIHESQLTLVFENLPKYFPRMVEFIDRMRSQSPDLKFHLSAYLTPAGSKGFAAHWDLMDVLMLQISGEKSWKVWDPIYSHPFYSADQLGLEGALKSYCHFTTPRKEEVLVPGSALYLPRGFIHEGKSTSFGSLHVSIGFRKTTLHDRLQEAIRADETIGGPLNAVIQMNLDSNFYQDDQRFQQSKNVFFNSVRDAKYVIA